MWVRLLLNTMIECKICNNSFKSYGSLSKHLRDIHGINSKIYYDAYFLPSNPNICRCGVLTEWHSISVGYKLHCSRKCAAENYREELKSDHIKFNQFTNKLSIIQKEVWEHRELTGEKSIIFDKVSETAKKTNALLTKQELADRNGWLNKLSFSERQKRIEEILDGSLRKFWNAASNEEKTEVVKRRQATKLERGIIAEESDMYRKYNTTIRRLTEHTYKQYKDEINPTGYVRGRGKSGYHVDHILSIKDGYLNCIPPEIMASKCNLQMLPGLENSIKQGRSYISKEELYKRWDTIIVEYSSQKILQNM